MRRFTALLSILVVCFVLHYLFVESVFALAWPAFDCSVGDYSAQGSCSSANNPFNMNDPNTFEIPATGWDTCQYYAREWNRQVPSRPVQASSCTDGCWVNINSLPANYVSTHGCIMSKGNPTTVAFCPRNNDTCVY